MSALKRIIPGRNRSPPLLPQSENPSNLTNRDPTKKPSLFRRQTQTPTQQPQLSQSREPTHTNTTKPKHHVIQFRTAQSPTPKLTEQVHHLAIHQTPLSTPPYSAPHAPADIFRLGHLPNPTVINLETLLQQSLRHVTIKRAAAARSSLVTALTNLRDLSVLSPVVEEYLPYALTCWDIAEHLKKKGNTVANGITWLSGLLRHTSSQYHGGFGLEAALVLTLSALCKLRNVVETSANFAMHDDQALVSQIKSLQVAAGMFDYAHDQVTPKAIADFVGNPPPELIPEVSALFSSLCLCLAQALHVRRAVLGGMSVATLAKLSAAAKQLATQVLEKHNQVTSLGVDLTSDVKTLADDIMTLTTGWTLQYLGATTQAKVDSGAKVTSLREAIATLKTARSSRIVGNVAALDLHDLDKQLDDAVEENCVVFQHVIPHIKDLRLPQGRSLVSATTYDAKRIPMAKTAPRH